MAVIRRRLGKSDGEPVSADEIAAAMDVPRAPVAASAGGPADDGTVTVPTIADGTYLVDGDILKRYQERALAGDRAVRAMHVGERDQILAAAVHDGKFPQARKEYFERLWDKDPDGTRSLVKSLASGLVPMDPVGSNGEFATDPDMAADFDAQKAYRTLYPDDIRGGKSAAPGVRS